MGQFSLLRWKKGSARLLRILGAFPVLLQSQGVFWEFMKFFSVHKSPQLLKVRNSS